ncbi:cytochrome b [Pseudomonas yamanorum]|uniref:Cytochrome b/b6 domain-containing protein n=1 Tax=Pseudomonas yamanorum TaxID=515393 RepID=A0A7Y8K9F5_9PSED|nr:cytochrome b/b6 domain-containing protein [Pseudomonas yamanorum]NWE79600.1 cytochrome b/b6 domain-containing protein [Pseudomonas yamanorum]
MSVSGYSRQRVLLHWLSAVVILWTLVSGFYIASLPVPAAIKQAVGFFNVSLTTVFIPVFVWRIFLTILHAQPARVRSLSLVQLLATFGHLSIYLMVGVVLFSGVLMMDRPISVFALLEIPQPLSDPVLIARCFAVHIVACVMLLLLVLLHIGAVVVHELCGDRVLRRMLLRPRVHVAQPRYK